MISIAYKCRCMAEEATVNCQPRREGEDVSDYMGYVQTCLGADHRARSPLCLSTTMEYAKVPVEAPEKGIGFEPTKQ